MAEYEAYKDSCTSWMGMVPSHWKIERAKWHFTMRNERGNEIPVLLAATQKYGMYPQNMIEGVVKVADGTDVQQFRTVHKGDFVISLRSFQGGFERSDYEGVCSPAYQVFFADESWDNDYLKYLFKNELFIDAMNALTVGIREGRNIKYEDFANSTLAIPPLNEQRTIAAYLARETDRIDAIVAEAKASIDEYKAWKTALVNDAVTHGINGDAPCKDSNIYWVGNMPEHWETKRLKYMFAIKKDIAGEAGHTILAITQQGVKPKNMADKGQFAADYSNYQLVRAGDFAMNHMDLLTGWVDISAHDGVTSPDYRVFYALSPNEICKDYYKHVFQNCYRCRIFYGLGHGVSGFGRWRLPADMFLNFVLPVPPMEEQQKIAEHLNTQCAQIDSLIAEKEALIADLEAYKKSLIFEIVTGKRKVV